MDLARLAHVDARRFDDYARLLTVRTVAVMATVLLAAMLTAWPFDALVIDSPRTLEGFRWWRAGCALAQLGLVIGVIGARRSTVGVAVVVVAGFVVNAFLTGFAFGGMPHDHDWFHVGTLVPFATLALIVGLEARIALTLVTAGAFLVGFVAANPDGFVRPYLAATGTLLAFAVGVSVVFGHILYVLVRSHHSHREALAGHGAQLEAAVADRTAELRDLARHLQVSREQERQRVARELHDELGQVAAALRLEVDVARSHTTASGTIDTRVLGDLVRIDDAVGSLLGSIRSLVHELRPRVLDDLGLVAAVSAHVAGVAERAKLAIDLAVEPQAFEVDAERGTACFRVLQEALTNVVKHAKATRVQVALALRAGELALEVVDDGRGLGAGPRRAGFGLVGMRERAAALGGTLEVGVGPAGGTRIALRLPAPAGAAVGAGAPP
jgi:signal transduction histidine kinase